MGLGALERYPSYLLVAMDHPKYLHFRKDFLNAPGWQCIPSSDETDDDNLDGLLTPVSLTHHYGINDSTHQSSAHLTQDSLSVGEKRKCFATRLRQRKVCSGSPRRPITRSYGNDCVSLDYRRKGFVVYRPATKNISMTFQRYLRFYVRHTVS